MSKFANAIQALYAAGSREEKDIYHDAIRVLEAAEKVDKKDAIKNLNDIFVFGAIHGLTTPIPSVVAAMALLESLPEDSK